MDEVNEVLDHINRCADGMHAIIQQQAERIAELERELAAYKTDVNAEVKRWGEPMLRIIERQRALEADAARYRYLREQQHNNTQLIKAGKPFIAIRVYDGYHFAASDPDAAIDAARQETGE